MKNLLLRLVGCLFAWVCVLSALGQSVQLATPREAVETHLRNLGFGETHWAKSFPKSAAAPFNHPDLRNEINEKERIRRARMLKEIYEGLGKYIDFAAIPDDPNYRDSTMSNPNAYLLFTHLGYPIYLEKVRNNWYYSPETIRLIPELYEIVFIIDTEKLFGIDLFNPPQTFLLLTAWQWAGLAAMLLLTLLMYRLAVVLLIRVPVAMLKRADQADFADNYIVPVASPLVMATALFALNTFLPALHLPIAYMRYVYPTLTVIWVVQFATVIYKSVNLIGYYVEKIYKKNNWNYNEQLALLFKRILRVLIVFVTVVYLLQYIFNLNVAGVIAGLSIGGLAVALAAQDTLKNLFGSVMIFLDKPFKIGDWIIGDRVDGRVEYIGFRSTQIRTFANSVTVIPNGRLADLTLENMGMRQKHRFRTMISIVYSTPPDLIFAYVEGLRTMATAHPHIEPDDVLITLFDFTDSAIQIRFQVFINVTDIKQELMIREELILHIIRLAAALGVQFAFPSTSLYVEKMPESKNTLPHKINPEEYQKITANYVNNYVVKKEEGV
ncbi:MAG: mechanosensitive ion channel family protein [Cytophagales bacterium]|nr:mechanosensitive ion channel family protein [Bernardetiaceae bacterium]MDW8204556.1 mechanosensitive ion channel family protein [Cytophagales bacterium]